MLFNRKKALKIRLLGDSMLSAKAKPVEVIDDDVRELAGRMIEYMYKLNGVGLAATQVGIPRRIVALHVDMPHDEDDKPLPLSSPGEMELLHRMPVVLINPEIISYSSNKELREEGCLSVPKIYGQVERPVSLVLKTQLLDGSHHTLDCGGFLARAIQHELDHLDGVVFVQRVKSPDFEEILPQLEKIIKKSGQKNYKIKRLMEDMQA